MIRFLIGCALIPFALLGIATLIITVAALCGVPMR
jgi:hypothetical protein